MSALLNNFKETRIPVVEIFHSISGEGVSTGNVVTFVRVAGCDLRCTWCDTKYSFKTKGDGVEQLLPDEIADRVKEIGTKEIICSGGEPLEHNLSKRYLPAYLQSLGYNVRIETSGGSKLYSQKELQFFQLNNSTRPVYTMDVKCPASGMVSHNNFENFTLLDKRDELKFVVANNEDIEYSLQIINDNSNLLSEKEITLNFSPVFGAIEAVDLVELLKTNQKYFQEKNLKARLSLQVHKIIWPPHLRGV